MDKATEVKRELINMIVDFNPFVKVFRYLVGREPIDDAEIKEFILETYDYGEVCRYVVNEAFSKYQTKKLLS